MNVLLAMAEPDSGGQVQQIAATFGVDWSHLIAQIISFSIVCVLLHRFAYKPVLKMLEQRRQQIAQGLADTKQIAAELARTESQRQEIMLQANANATRLIEEARTAARQVHQEETQKAIAAAEKIIARSHEAATQEYARMLIELKREVGMLVVQATTTVVGKTLTADDQRRLAEETTERLAA
jgi:F-type H+-transporting ATPase subunit b